MVEMTIAMVLMSATAAIFGPMLTSSMTKAHGVEGQSEAIDNLEIAATSIARELRSAQCIISPAENATGTTLDFTTTANNTQYEVVYSVSGTKLTRHVVGGSTITVADYLVSTSNIFQQIATPRRTVNLNFQMQPSPKNTPRVLNVTVAGRNAWRSCPAALGP
jgi:hypothetical protein